ncbi:HNH endonuclease domain-containing protein [Bacillus thuringiensis]|uniref:HNH endonuclease domain-containing protein n=1 Tax=Bacillus thuringiensis TaxID=1428 RepID=UPI001EE09CA4|nr:HNH endonuclease domain-containing protein [Bacillus thuringiensis]MCG3425528.1 hypothetical protein [Bacillus thuringiensis]
MIKLDSTILENYKQEYSKNTLNIINANYKVKKSKMQQLNLFNSQKLEILFGNWSIKFLNDLLNQPIEYIIKNYSEVKKYYEVAQMVNYSKFKINHELARYGLKKNTSSRQDFRKQFVQKYSNDWLTKILKKHPEYFKTDVNFKKMIKEVKEQLLNLNELISHFINYDFIDPITRHELLVSMDIPVCPYCNRQYITSYYSDNNLKKTTADLDHFLPKSYFSLFSLSLHNFVPSCQICNSRFKLNKGLEIINPYIDNFHAKFTVSLKKDSEIDSILGVDSEFELSLKIIEKNLNKKIIIKNTADLFQLNNVYQIHKNLVREILYKNRVYTKTHKEQLKKLFEQDMKLTETDINLFLYGNDLSPDNFHLKPLSKLSYDVLKDIDVTK